MIGRYVLTYIMDGEGSFNGEPIRRGDFCFSTPYDGHVIREKPQAPLEYYYISIGGTNASSFFQDLGLFSISLTQKCSFINQIPAVFNDMLYTEHPDKDTEIYLIGAFLQLISMHKKELVNYTQRSESESFRQYKEALLYIQDHLLKGITPIDVAHYLHISPSYLRAIFAKHCKYTLRELLIRQRLECAAKRLIYDDSSVAQAANFVGYTNYTLFSSIFKKYIGYSPQEYKKLHRNINNSSKS